MLILTEIILMATIFGNFALLFIINYFEGAKTKFKLVLNFYLLGILGWASTILLNLYLQNLVVEKFIFAFPVIIMASHFVLAEIFPRGSFFGRKRNYLLLIPPVIFFIASFFDNVYFTQINITKDGYTILDQGYLSVFYTLFIMLYIIFPVFILYKKYKSEINLLIKSQLKYLMIGFTAFLVSAILSNLILPHFFNFYFLNGIGPIFSLLMIVFIIFDIIYFHLFDIQFIVRLTTIYSILYVFFTFIYAFFVSNIHYYVSGLFQYLVPSAIVVFGFVPFKNFIEFSTDKIFFRRRYNFSDVVKKIEDSIHSAGLDLDKAIESVSRDIENSMRVEKAVVLIVSSKNNFILHQISDNKEIDFKIRRDSQIINYLKTHKGEIIERHLLARKINESDSPSETEREVVRELEEARLCLVVPIEFKDELIGACFFSHKLSGALFNNEDIKLLNHVAWELGFAIDNAKSYEELKKLDKIKSEFISVASHQLRTPVSIMRWNLDLVLDKKEKLSSKEMKEILKGVYQGVVSIDQRLGQLMIALEIQEEHVALRTKLIDITLLIKASVKKLSGCIKEKQLKLEFGLAGLMKVDCDNDKIAMVLDIIINNAANYTSNEGNIKISSFIKEINGKNSFVVSVCDNGVGIKEEEKGEIFKKFYRSDNAKLMSPNGFGLGLYIAKKFVQAHGGDLWFESNFLNKGMTFFFSIPK
jgi:signal transduction histidine kinase